MGRMCDEGRFGIRKYMEGGLWCDGLDVSLGGLWDPFGMWDQGGCGLGLDVGLGGLLDTFGMWAWGG